MALGFQQFTSSFNRSCDRRLRDAGVHLSMAIRTNENAFFNFFFDAFPGSRRSVHGDTKVFFGWIKMVEFKGLRASLVPADGAGAALVGDGEISKPLASLCDGLLEVIGTVGVGALVFHDESVACPQSSALPLSYPGMGMIKVQRTGGRIANIRTIVNNRTSHPAV